MSEYESRPMLMPKDDFPECDAVGAWVARCRFHEKCGSPKERWSELMKAMQETPHRGPLRCEPQVTVVAGSDDHVFYFKFDANGVTWRAGSAADLDTWRDYSDTWRNPKRRGSR